MTVPDPELYSGAEWAAIDGWAPPPPPRPEPADVAGLRRTTAGGAVAAALLLGLRDALDPPRRDEDAEVVDVEGAPDDPSAAVALHFDAWSPAATVAVVRPGGGGGAEGAVQGRRR